MRSIKSVKLNVCYVLQIQGDKTFVLMSNFQQNWGVELLFKQTHLTLNVFMHLRQKHSILFICISFVLQNVYSYFFVHIKSPLFHVREVALKLFYYENRTKHSLNAFAVKKDSFGFYFCLKRDNILKMSSI